MIKTILVLGAGSWGGALALHLARQNQKVLLWGHHPEKMKALQTSRQSPYLPGQLFPQTIEIIDSIKAAFAVLPENAIIMIAVPSRAFVDVLSQIQPFVKSSMKILWVTKGLSAQGEWLHDVIKSKIPNCPLACLSGPSFALEVAKAMPTAVTIATDTPEFSKELIEAFHSERFRIYRSDDLLGVELGGVVKNVLAIAVGMSDGLGFGANAKSALITRGMAEMSRLGLALGAKLPTLMGLAGLGDMVLTCTDNQSRNRRFGLALGQGQSIDAAIKAIGQVVEGQANAAQLVALAKKHQIEMPICQQVYEVLFAGISAKQAVDNLLNRPPREEEI